MIASVVISFVFVAFMAFRMSVMLAALKPVFGFTLAIFSTKTNQINETEFKTQKTNNEKNSLRFNAKKERFQFAGFTLDLRKFYEVFNTLIVAIGKKMICVQMVVRFAVQLRRVLKMK